MQTRKSRLLKSFLMFNLAGCQTPVIEEKFQGLDKAKSCSLKSYRLDNLVMISLSKIDAISVQLDLSLSSMQYLTNLHHNPIIIINIFKADEKIDTLKYQGLSKSMLPAFENEGARSLANFAQYIVNIQDLKKIVQADNIEFIVQTNDEPLKLKLQNEQLGPFTEFHRACLKDIL